jgi:hypothetical protein
MMGSSLLIRGRWSEYRDYLISETRALAPGTRWLYVRSFATPWLGVLFVGCVLCVILDSIFNLGALGRAAVLAPFSLIGFSGMLYSSWIIFYYGIRVDIQRMKETRAKGSHPPFSDLG